MKSVTMQPSDEAGQFIRNQTSAVVWPRPLPACMHNRLRSSDVSNQTSDQAVAVTDVILLRRNNTAHFGGVYDDSALQQTPINWNYGRTRRSTGKHVHYLDRAAAEAAAKNPFNRLFKWLRNFVHKL